MQAFRNDDHGSIRSTQRKIRIPLHERRDACQVSPGQTNLSKPFRHCALFRSSRNGATPPRSLSRYARLWVTRCRPVLVFEKRTYASMPPTDTSANPDVLPTYP